MKWNSSPIIISLQSKQYLSCRGVTGRVYRPRSIERWWALIFNSVKWRRWATGNNRRLRVLPTCLEWLRLSRRARDTTAARLHHSRHRGESATKTIKFFVAHTVNYVICNNHTRIDWVLLNFTPVIQQNYHQPGRKFEKLFCAVDRLSCQLELWKSETSQFRSDVVFDIVNYVHLIFFHGSKCCFEIFNEFRLLCCLNFMGQECAGIAPESSRFWQHFYAVPVYIYWDDILSHFPDDFWRNLSSNKARTD